MSSYTLRFFARTDPGLRRRVNEDALVLEPEFGFCILCDGMGGHASGEVASTMAVETVARELKRHLLPVAVIRACPVPPALADVEQTVVAAIEVANSAIYERGHSDDRLESGRPMGTTITVLVFVGDVAVVAHIGDSRIYRVRDATIEALTTDHIVTVPDGQQPGANRKRKYVTRALGTRTAVVADVQHVPVVVGDRFYLCSDGLTDVVGEAELTWVLAGAGSEDLAEVPCTLVALANRRGGPDNISVVLVAVDEARGRTPPLPPAPDPTGVLTADDLGVHIDHPPPPDLTPPPRG